MDKKHLERIGQKFHYLEIKEIYHKDYRGTKTIYVNCKCECGNYKEFMLSALIQSARSCGCKTKELHKKAITKHGMTDSRLYRIRRSMIQRCYYPKSISYKYYGGKGITVCEEWKNSFESFYEWAINNGYEKHLSIDRIDNKKGYCPENCKWSTSKEQIANRDIEEMREKARKRYSKAIKQIDPETNEVLRVFDSITNAKKETGITTIGHCLKGRAKTSGGFRWEYCY